MEETMQVDKTMQVDNKEKLALAMQLVSRREYPQSEQIFKDLIASGSELAESFYGIGMIRLASGKLEDATKQFENCVKLHPNHANAHYYLGEIAERRNDPDGAKRSYQKAIEINPRHAGALKKVGPSRQPELQRTESLPVQSDFYGLLRRSGEPVEQEISRHLDAIAALIGDRCVRFRAVFGLLARFWRALGWLALLVAGAFLFGALNTPRNSEAKELLLSAGLALTVFFIFSVLFPLVVSLRAKNSKIKCERDWLLLTKGVLTKSTKNVHLFLLSRGEVSVHQTIMNRRTGDGILRLTGLSLRGYFSKPELDDLSQHFRQLSLLNPTSRNILAALGELKQIRSGAN
jgi:tetratricopeptide (TPR) repeat protein